MTFAILISIDKIGLPAFHFCQILSTKPPKVIVDPMKSVVTIGSSFSFSYSSTAHYKALDPFHAFSSFLSFHYSPLLHNLQIAWTITHCILTFLTNHIIQQWISLLYKQVG